MHSNESHVEHAQEGPLGVVSRLNAKDDHRADRGRRDARRARAAESRALMSVMVGDEPHSTRDLHISIIDNQRERRHPPAMSQLARIRRLPAADDQYKELVALGATAYAKEGPGDVYFCVRFPPSLVAAVNAGRLPVTALKAADLEIKGGSARDVDRRIPQYTVCQETQPLLFWAYCSVPYCRLTERLLHLKLKALGADLVPEPCDCKVKHREFFSLSVFSTIEDFEAVVKSVVEDAGESNLSVADELEESS
ncbi:hypothetical protein B0H15DRAFT_796054 [Mycena belliarum]|uniref:Bacteriophage T5 Orf172 DNA-binding domain-containing protein n=1 Tax=Mycena belliarum TaxID=1033014 RepID=A0AAD6XXC0_9AGAR|nr:hypothetical protein B0H15DRAFT_796054 [Mycena belliae]